MRVEDFLRQVCATLEEAGVQYMLTGSLASSIHGVPRSTQDVDIVVAPREEQLATLIEAFQSRGLYVSGEEAASAFRLRTQFNVIDFANGWKADLLLRKEREFSLLEFGRRVEMDLQGMRLVVASAEDVLISKLEWAKVGGSDRQIEDAAGIVRLQGDELDLAYVERWVASLLLQEQWQSVRSRATA